MIKMELKKGMYIRSKDKAGNQFIKKIVDLPEDTRYGSIVVDKDIHNVLWVSKKNVLKASFDLFDLIEVGDFLDNHCVEKIKDDTIYLNDGYFIAREDIEEFVSSIVTKEQFEACKYVIERNE